MKSLEVKEKDCRPHRDETLLDHIQKQKDNFLFN